VQTIYEVPLMLEAESLGNFITERLGLPQRKPQLADWEALVEKIKRPKREVRIALVGKYIDLRDAYLSVREALEHAAIYHDRAVVIKWVDAEQLEQEGPHALLSDVSGIVVPGGFGYRGTEGKVLAARYARENNKPYLGLCLGMHVMVIELMRSIVGSNEPNSTEFDPKTQYPVIDLLGEQRDVSQKGGTMRLGAYPCILTPGTKAARAYGEQIIYERHRHRFEFNNEYRNRLTQAGLVIAGLSPDGKLVEIVELADHPWMVACQFHPEFKSRPTRPHPLFREFMNVAKETLIEGDQRPLPLEQMLA
jgi:CTP synthase